MRVNHSVELVQGGKTAKYKAVIFDLFGTLIPNFSASEYRRTVLQVADILKAPPEAFWELWSATFKEGVLGFFPTPESKIEYICGKLGVMFSLAALHESAQIRYDFEKATMHPRPEAVGVLRGLRSLALKIGLITDCSAEAPREWPNTSLAPWFDVTVFSCLVGMKKPDPRIYNLALSKLRVTAQESLYIGDGSSQELTGAAAVGIDAVLLKAPGEQHPDVYRVDLEDWKGVTITSLKGVMQLL
jgi:putative hydrolase of the HAD superfamily